MSITNSHFFIDINSLQYSWLDVFVLSGFLISYGILLYSLFFIFWRWASIISYQNLVTQFRQGRGNVWFKLVLIVFICFSGLPPFFFFFNKLNLLIYVIQQATFLKSILILIFLSFSWYAYFSLIRWLSLNQTNVGYTKYLTWGLFSVKSNFIWVIVLFILLGFIFFMDDFYIFTLWLFY